MRLAKTIQRLRAPRRRYNIFCGANTWSEWRIALRESRSPSCGDEEVERYESAFARLTDAESAISFAAGRMGLYAILEALGVGAGDEVIIPAFTCVVVPNAIRYRGARPVFVDIEPRTFNVDVGQVARLVTPRTRALYAQHTFGLVCNVEALVALARQRGLPVIEDAAHALGATHAGHPVGSLGDIAFFSTDHTKVINTHVGGMVTTNDAGLAKRVRRIQEAADPLPSAFVRRMARSLAVAYPLYHPRMLWCGDLMAEALWRMGFFQFFDDELDLQKPTRYPYPAKLSSFQARLGISQLGRLGDNLRHRRRIGLELEQRIHWLRDLLMPGGMNHAFLRYAFLVKDRDAFLRRFAARFDLGVWFTSVVHGRTTGLDRIGYIAGSCPNAEYVVRHVVNFPTHPRIDPTLLLAAVDRENAAGLSHTIDWWQYCHTALRV